jgi:hypothetical protein
VGTKLSLALGGDDDFPDGEAARLLREREDQTAVAGARLETDTRVANFWRTDQFVERDLIRLGER